MVLVALAAVLLLAGCATPPAAVTIIASVPCLPPGVRGDFFGWPVVGFQPIVLHREHGGDVEARVVRYQRGRDAVAVLWVGADLVAVDPRPDSEEPEWVDDSLVVGDEMTLRARPEVPCQWRRHKSAARAVPSTSVVLAGGLEPAEPFQMPRAPQPRGQLATICANEAGWCPLAPGVTLSVGTPCQCFVPWQGAVAGVGRYFLYSMYPDRPVSPYFNQHWTDPPPPPPVLR